MQNKNISRILLTSDCQVFYSYFTSRNEYSKALYSFEGADRKLPVSKQLF